MKSLYDPSCAPDDPLELRAYTSRLLGREPSLVLHGGGNTSVKLTVDDFFGEPVEALYVKGSGWDLASIEPAGFSPVRLSTLRRMAMLDRLSDTDMVREQRAALLNPNAPNPSVEAILHAVIDARYVDHSHADAVVTLSNSPEGDARVRALYGDRVLLVPYVMPGFILAKQVSELLRDVDQSKLDAIILLNHGVFTFGDTARESYERHIAIVRLAEQELERAGVLDAVARRAPETEDLQRLAELRRAVSNAAGRAMIARWDRSEEAAGFATRDDVGAIATRGPVTPDHVIRTKRVPVIVEDDIDGAVADYVADYRAYFDTNKDPSLTMLDPAPRWAVDRKGALVAFGTSVAAADQVRDIARHSATCVQWGEALGGWAPLGPGDIFAMEYWELEQRKLARRGKGGVLAGQVAVLTGAAHGIGAASVEQLLADGAAVCALDIDPSVVERFDSSSAFGMVCDVTRTEAVDAAIAECARRFGGIDIVVSNAGDFPPSARIEDIDDEGPGGRPSSST